MGAHLTLGRNKMDPSLDSLVGLSVSHFWFGDYSALYLELGDLKPSGRVRKDGSPTNPQGEFTVYAGFDWRIERPKSIFPSRRKSIRQLRSITAKLVGATVTSATTFGRIPELQIGFSNGLFIATFSLSPGDPEWSVSFNRQSTLHLCTVRGRLAVDGRDYKPSE